MSPIDKKDHALVTQQLKRSKPTGAQQYTLPKPYRHTPGPDERKAMSKSTLAMLALAGLLIAGLIAELVAIVQENMRVRKLPVIAAIVPEVRPSVLPGVAIPPPVQDKAPAGANPAPAPEPAEPAENPQAHPEATPAASTEIASEITPAVAPEITSLPALALQPSTERAASASGALLPASTSEPRVQAAAPAAALYPKKTHLVRAAAKPATAAPAPDPDVALVTAILMLTAKPELSERVSVCDPGMAKEATCSDIHGMVP